MRCRIAGLTVEVPEGYGMAARCEPYACEPDAEAQIVLREERYSRAGYPGKLPDAIWAYLESGQQFYLSLLSFGGMMLHASAIAVDGRAYCFSGPSGVGKSTHTALWLQQLGQRAVLFNDDKPALRRMDGVWCACGTPWAGKHGINEDLTVPLAGVCYLKQAQENRIRRLSVQESIHRLLDQTIRGFGPKHTELLLQTVSGIVSEIPFYELENRPEPAAALLSYETMRGAIREETK